MMAAMARIQQRALLAESMIVTLRTQLSKLSEDATAAACKKEEAELAAENDQLKAEVQVLKSTLCKLEERNGVKQVSIPKKPSVAASPAGPAAPAKAAEKPVVNGEKAETNGEAKPQQAKKEKKPKEAKPKAAAADASEPPIDVSRLDMRIGKIIGVKRHPDADALYVEDVDLGEGRTRTVVSGLVNHVTLEEMQDRVAVFMCNLKPAKMRGILSEGMIMCGSTPEKVEIIVPPADAQIGDRVSVDAFPGIPDEQLNPKKKVWEQVQPDLKISDTGAACYKGEAWKVGTSVGLCTVPSLKDVQIK